MEHTKPESYDKEGESITPTEENTKPVRRKSCDICTRRKRKCEGGDPCPFCASLAVQCVYSIKQKSGRRKKVPTDASQNSGQGIGSYQAGTDTNNSMLPRSTIADALASFARVDTSLSFQASVVTGLTGFQENALIKVYLRELNQMLPLTDASSVVKSVQEVVTRGVRINDPTDAVRCSRLAMFWSVCSVGSRISGYTEAMTEGYKARAADALQYCYDAHIKEVAEALLVLGTVEGMQGNTEMADRYRGFAEMSHLLLRQYARSHPQLTFDGASEDAYSQRFGSLLAVYGPRMLDTHEAKDYVPTLDVSIEELVRRNCAQPTADPVYLLRMHVGIQKYVLVALNPASSLSDVSASLISMDWTWYALNLSRDKENATSAVPYFIWHGITRVMMGDIDNGLNCMEWGVQMALNFPGLVTYTFWWHGFHCCAIVLFHHNRLQWYRRLISFYNPATFPGSELPPAEEFDMSRVCREGHLCRMFADWLCKYQPNGALTALPSYTYAQQNVERQQHGLRPQEYQFEHPFETALQENPYAHENAHMHAQAPTHTCTHTHTHTHTHTDTHAHTAVHTHTLTHPLHTPVDIHAHAHTPVDTHTHTSSNIGHHSSPIQTHTLPPLSQRMAPGSELQLTETLAEVFLRTTSVPPLHVPLEHVGSSSSSGSSVRPRYYNFEEDRTGVGGYGSSHHKAGLHIGQSASTDSLYPHQFADLDYAPVAATLPLSNATSTTSINSSTSDVTPVEMYAHDNFMSGRFGMSQGTSGPFIDPQLAHLWEWEEDQQQT